MTITDKLTGIRITDHTGKQSRQALDLLLRYRVEQLKDQTPWLRREVKPRGPEFEPLYGLVVKPEGQKEDQDQTEAQSQSKPRRKARAG